MSLTQPALESYLWGADDDRFVIPDGAHWKDVRAVAKDVGQALQKAMRDIDAANPLAIEGSCQDLISSWSAPVFPRRPTREGEDP